MSLRDVRSRGQYSATAADALHLPVDRLVLLLNLLITFTIPVIDKWAHLGGLFTGAVLAAGAGATGRADDETDDTDMRPPPESGLLGL